MWFGELLNSSCEYETKRNARKRTENPGCLTILLSHQINQTLDFFTVVVIYANQYLYIEATFAWGFLSCAGRSNVSLSSDLKLYYYQFIVCMYIYVCVHSSYGI